MKTLNEWTRAELLALPVRDWQTDSTYDSVLILSTRRKHDSGWAMKAIVGVKENQPMEIAVNCCDDIEWKFPAPEFLGNDLLFQIGQVRSDCAFRSGAVHFWARESKFLVGAARSSTDITLIQE